MTSSNLSVMICDVVVQGEIMRLVRKILKRLGLCLLGLVVAGVIYQEIGVVMDGKLAPAASEMVVVNGRAVHLVCMGVGPRTIVLDAGAGSATFEWWRLQPLLSKADRACAFDRAGLGWSAPSGGAHDGSTAADELGALVQAAKIPVPFVYVGHSLGANFAIIYQAKHPQDVAALVLLEPGDPKDMLEDFHGTRSEAMMASDCGVGCYAAGVAAHLGITRFAARIMNVGYHSMTGRALNEYRAELGRPCSIVATAASLAALPKTAYENLDVHSFGDTAVLVFASSKPRDPEGKETIADVEKWRAGQLAYLASLASMSTNGKGPIIIPDSTHSSMVMGEHQSEAMAQAIIAFISGLPR
jgi:pimeloyl-ACP methyl ester carboxylesterase